MKDGDARATSRGGSTTPKGIVSVEVCRLSGKLPNEGCREVDVVDTTARRDALDDLPRVLRSREPSRPSCARCIGAGRSSASSRALFGKDGPPPTAGRGRAGSRRTAAPSRQPSRRRAELRPRPKSRSRPRRPRRRSAASGPASSASARTTAGRTSPKAASGEARERPATSDSPACYDSLDFPYGLPGRLRPPACARPALAGHRAAYASAEPDFRGPRRGRQAAHGTGGRAGAELSVAASRHGDDARQPRRGGAASARAVRRVRACRRIARRVHSDVVWLAPIEDKATVAHRAGAGLNEQVGYRPFEARSRVVIVDNAADVLLPVVAERVAQDARGDRLPARCSCSSRRSPRACSPPSGRGVRACDSDRLPAADVAACLERDHGVGSADARAQAAVSDGSIGVALGAAAHRGRAHRCRSASCSLVARARDARGRLDVAKEIVGKASKGTGLGERDSLAVHLRLLHGLLRDLGILSTRADAGALANADLEPRAGAARAGVRSRPARPRVHGGRPRARSARSQRQPQDRRRLAGVAALNARRRPIHGAWWILTPPARTCRSG